jgi:hypothetical protein
MPRVAPTGQAQPRVYRPSVRPKPDAPARSGGAITVVLGFLASLGLLAASAGLGILAGILVFSTPSLGYLPFLANLGGSARLLVQAALVIGGMLLALGFLILPMWANITGRNGQQQGRLRYVTFVKTIAVFWVLALVAVLALQALGGQFGRTMGDIMQTPTQVP